MESRCAKNIFKIPLLALEDAAAVGAGSLLVDALLPLDEAVDAVGAGGLGVDGLGT